MNIFGAARPLGRTSPLPTAPVDYGSLALLQRAIAVGTNPRYIAPLAQRYNDAVRASPKWRTTIIPRIQAGGPITLWQGWTNYGYDASTPGAVSRPLAPMGTISLLVPHDIEGFAGMLNEYVAKRPSHLYAFGFPGEDPFYLMFAPLIPAPQIA